MATEEARTLLDSLMGGDRNAPLPPGAAVPSKRKRAEGEGGQLLLPGKRNKSCYDRDIDPLYTAWGVDVFELFVNTKSDLGANPYIVDEAAHEEFVKLPEAEQTKLGFNYFLFQKLQELVRQCDRTVTRNKEKLHQEVSRKLSQRGGQDFVEDVDEKAVESLARDMVTAEKLMQIYDERIDDLDKVLEEEEAKKEKLEKLMETKKTVIKTDTTEQRVEEESEVKEGTSEEKVNIKEEDPSPKASIKGENTGENKTDDELTGLQMDLGKATMKKQSILFELANIIAQMGPLEESIEAQRRNLNYVKSDISTDKTVCDVSGNFMSSRDADERIAAHYAGKQYVGWKLVRDKFAEMVKKFGRYGPPPPGRDGIENAGPMLSMGRGRGGGFDRRGGGGYDRGGGGGGRGRFDDGAGFRGGGGGPDRGRWERGGPPPPDYRDRRGPPGPPRGNWRR